MAKTGSSHVRYVVVLMLFLGSTFSYGDRVVLSIAGVLLQKDLHIDAVRLGYLFSGFSWAYVCGQLPAGGLLDRFGSRVVYGISIIGWSICALLAGFAGFLPATAAFYSIFCVRFLSGLAQSPVFPGNGRIVAEWLPAAERGFASAVFNSSQYFSLVLFAPVMGWVAHFRSWRDCFLLVGGLGVVFCGAWFKLVYRVNEHPRISQSEIDHIEQGGGLVNLDREAQKARSTGNVPTLSSIKMLLSNRMLVGVYLGQYCITTLTWFFLTWFPVYLSQARHLSIVKVGVAAALPALCGCIGGVLGGAASDALIRRGYSLTFARKAPIVLGMAFATSMVACNYANLQWVVIVLMCVAFFGKGIGALGWTVVSDTSPKEVVGLSGGLFNLIGNLAGITTPIIIGYIVEATHSFNGALLYVAGTALFAIFCYTCIVGEIKRVHLPIPSQTLAGGARTL